MTPSSPHPSFARRLAVLALAALPGLALAFLAGGNARAWRLGPPENRVGICGFGSTCRDAGCHSISGSPTLVWELLQEDPAPGPLPPAYVPGRVYRLRLQITDPDPEAVIWGFELAPVTGCPFYARAGVMEPVNDQRVRHFEGEGGIWYLSHGCPCPAEDPGCCGYVPPSDPDRNGWSFLWTAPPRGQGDVTFYFSINAADGDGSSLGDKIVQGNVTLPEEPCSTPLVRDLAVRRAECDGQPSTDDLELVWAEAPGDVVRATSLLSDLPRSRDTWPDAGGPCQPLADGVELTFYSVGRICDLGGEGH